MIRFLPVAICGLALALLGCGKDDETLVEGQVVWADDGEPVPDAYVQAWMTNEKLSTKSTSYNEQAGYVDEEGRFRFAFDGDDDVVGIPVFVSIPTIVDGDTVMTGFDQTQLDCGDPCEDEEGLRPGRSYDLILRVPR